MWPAHCPRSAATECLPLTPNYVAREVWERVCPVMMCSQSPHCPDSPVHTQSHPLTGVFSCLPLPLLCSPLLSCSSPRVSYSFEVTTGGVLETLRSCLTFILQQPSWFTAAVSADSSSWCSQASWQPLHTQVNLLLSVIDIYFCRLGDKQATSRVCLDRCDLRIFFFFLNKMTAKGTKKSLAS